MWQKSALDILGKHDKAIEYRNKCIELDPESVVYTCDDKDICLANPGKYDEAVE